MAGSAWKDEFYVKVYELAKTGMKEHKIARAIGVTINTWKKWKVKRPALRRALKQAQNKESAEAASTFRDYVYKRLPVELQKVWDQIDLLDREPNGVKRIEALVAHHGKHARQHLFLYALTHSCFNVSEACRKMCLPRKSFETWMVQDPDFAALMDEIHICKKDFFEGALVRLVERGDTTATLFVNKVFNRDRGYVEPSQRIDVSGQVNHAHLHGVVDIEKLNLPLEVRKLMLKAIREQDSSVSQVDQIKEPETIGT